MMGPNTIIDKSFLQMLNPAEIFEFSLYFRPVITPVLVREIIADLKKEPTSATVPRAVVQALATKLGGIHGLTPVGFRKAAIGNLLIHDIPMIGQVPVDTDAPNVHISRDGAGLLYDSLPEQRLWDRWSAGDFNVLDDLSARVWRAGLQRLRLEAVRDGWREYARATFAAANDVPTLIDSVSALFVRFDEETQASLLNTTLDFLQAGMSVRRFVKAVWDAGLIPRLVDIAPYTASVAKLAFVFVAGLGRGFIGPRPSHYIDLQYLFYAPFGNVFISSDKFHRDLWRATSGNNSFVWGPDLKADLANRITIRRNRTLEQKEREEKEYGFYPIEIEGSPISAVWKKYLRPREEIIGGQKDREDLKQNESEILKEIHQRLSEFDTFREK